MKWDGKRGGVLEKGVKGQLGRPMVKPSMKYCTMTVVKAQARVMNQSRVTFRDPP